MAVLPASAAEQLTPEQTAFLQRRVAGFGRLSAIVFGAFLTFRLTLGVGRSEDVVAEIASPSVGFHLVTTLVAAGMWLICRGRPRRDRLVRGVEAVGVVAMGWSLVGMGLDIPTVAAPYLIVALALTYVLVMRAVFIPSSPRRSLLMAAVIGVPFVAGTYVEYLDFPLDLLHRLLPETNEEYGTIHEFALNVAVEATAWWISTLVVTTAASQVIFGLRKEIREARRLGQYTLIEKLGEGGMGAVYKARHAMMRRPTAIKLLPPGKSSPEALERFEREVQLTAQLTHPNTITIYDYGRTPDGVFYYAMEHLDGATLGRLVETTGPMPPGRAVRVLSMVAGALSEAHQVGLIHRDIKPDNIMLTTQGGERDVAKVLDFGLVKTVDVEEDAAVTREGMLAGTPLYMAPETIKSAQLTDARSDLYALGAVGYFLVTGTHVFSGTSAIEVCSHHLHTEPVPPSLRAPAPIPEDLEALILACLAKEPADRPQSAADLLRRLAACRDVPPWTADDAELFWQENAAKLRTAATKVGTTDTVAIDLTQRGLKRAG